MARDIVNMRHMVMGMYDSPNWKARVANMPENQIIAIYFNSKKRGYFDKRAKANQAKHAVEPYQYTIFDYI